jgi:hypothetical protein
MPPDTLNPKYPPRTEQRPAIAVLDVFIVAWARPDGLVGLLVAKSSEPDFVNQLTVEVRAGPAWYAQDLRQPSQLRAGSMTQFGVGETREVCKECGTVRASSSTVH